MFEDSSVLRGTPGGASCASGIPRVPGRGSDQRATGSHARRFVARTNRSATGVTTLTRSIVGTGSPCKKREAHRTRLPDPAQGKAVLSSYSNGTSEHLFFGVRRRILRGIPAVPTFASCFCNFEGTRGNQPVVS